MVKNTRRVQRGEESLTRDRIIEEAIALLDSGGEGGLTFRALSARLDTGAGAIYWHVANKNDLLMAACDAVVTATMDAAVAGATPHDTIRAIGLGMFDAIDSHPWLGWALTQGAGQMPMVRILEGLGRQVRMLEVPEPEQWRAVSALLSYVQGVAGQNAANAQAARELDAVRATYLDVMATNWSQLDATLYPFTRSMAGQLRDHDDREDFVAGLDYILKGMAPRP